MGKLTLQEISRILMQKNGLSQREASQFATEMFSIILARLQEGDTVKVKGLGTFKIINVEARESVSVRTGERVVIDSHSKVSFTPDTIMRELVNKPFSQFETVVLNDGVEFEDINDDVTEDELATTEEPVVEEQSTVIEEPVVEHVSVVEQPVVDEPVADEPVAEESTAVTEESTELIDFYEDETPERPWGRWLLGAFGVLVLIAGAAYGGYEYGRQQQVAQIPDTVVVRDTVYMAELQDSASLGEAEEVILDELTSKESSKVESKPEAKEEPQKEEVDQWSAKDERVRLGAYRIVGLSHEVTVLEGQTFYSICRAHLGPDMQCYVEVYNNLPRNPQIKTGQVLKIPKLVPRKRRK